MKKKTSNLFFKEDIGNYKAGYAYKLELKESDIAKLLRQGCIYAAKDAKYYQEQKEVKNTKPKEIEQDVNENVDNKNIEQTEIQTKPTAAAKFFS